MNELTKSAVLDALKNITLPYSDSDVVSAGVISSIVIRGDKVGFAIEVDQNQLNSNDAESVRQACESVALSLPGVKTATVVLTAETSPPSLKQRPAPPTPKSMTNVKKIIAVASGKGGVGKSTIAVNLAAALAAMGMKTGLIDADIYGPSVAKMMGIAGEPEVNDKGQMIPKENHGVKCLSMALMLKEDTPIIWRGPMVTKALKKFIFGTHWGDLDFLVLDMPPGTGDLHLSLAQNLKLSGAIIVTTPQEVALLDVRKAISMFEKVNTPILGIVENMSYFEDEESGRKTYVFGKDKAQKLAADMNLEILAEIPVMEKLSKSGDEGKPMAANAEDGGSQFETIARRVIDILLKK